MKLEIFGSFINLTVIRCRHEEYLAISRHEIFGVMTSVVTGVGRNAPVLQLLTEVCIPAQYNPLYGSHMARDG